MDRSLADIHGMTLAGLNLITQAISIYDSDLKLVIANHQFRRMFDLPDHLTTAGARFGETIRHLAYRGDYGPITDYPTFIEERVNQARAFEPHYLERTRANGTTIAVEGSPLRQGGWVTVYSDITEIKRQEALLRNQSVNLSEELLSRSEELSKSNRTLKSTITALEEAKRDLTASQEQLSLTNEMTPAHIARVDINGVYTYSNHKLSTILPGCPGDVTGMDFAQALGAEVYSKIGPAFQRTLNGEAPVLEFEHKYTGRHIRVALTPDGGDGKPIKGAYLLSMDVTDEVSARHALAHTRRRELAAQLTSGLAHDFSNLLTIILGQNDLLTRLPDLPPEVAEISRTIRAAAKRGGALIDGLSQVDARRELEIKPVGFEAFISGFSQLAQAAVPENVVLSIQAAIPDAHLMLDSGFAQDALLNLVLNAVEAIENDGSIDVRIEKAGTATLEMIVADNGPGFSEQALQNALAPFFTSKSGKPGRGLGLSTAFDFAQSSGGTIRISNQNTGGALVTIRIPYVTAQPATPGVVLLVEDSEDVRKTVRGYLRRMGHAVIEADSAAEAFLLADLPEITHLVSDLILGEGPTGYEVAESLRKRNKDIPCLLVTGLDMTNDVRKFAAKHYPVLQKPFDYNALAVHLQKASHGQ